MKSRHLVISFVAILVLLLSSSAVAQRPNRANPGQRGPNLTAQQRSQIQTIRQQQRAKIEELSKQSMTREQFRTERMEIAGSTRQQIDNLLTTEQRAQMAARQGARQQGRRPMARRGKDL